MFEAIKLLTILAIVAVCWVAIPVAGLLVGSVLAVVVLLFLVKVAGTEVDEPRKPEDP